MRVRVTFDVDVHWVDECCAVIQDPEPESQLAASVEQAISEAVGEALPRATNTTVVDEEISILFDNEITAKVV